MGDLRERIKNIIESAECGREILKTVYKPCWMRFWLSKENVRGSGGTYYGILYALDVEYNDIDNYGTDMTRIFYTNKPQSTETLVTKIEDAISSYLQFKETLNIMGLIRDNQKSLPNGTGHQIITVHLPNDEDKVIDIPEGCYDYEDPYNIIGNYIEDNVNKDFPVDIPYMRDCLVVMKFRDDGYFNDVLMVENGKYVWGYDWWEGEDYVELVGYAPMDVLAEEIVKWSCSKSKSKTENH